MTIASVIALIVLFVVILSFLVAIPSWVPMASVGALAFAILLGGTPMAWRSS